MSKSQITTLSVFKFEQNKFWAFKQMRLALAPLQKVDGLIFSKVLGTGSGNGFSIFPDLGTYVLLLVWENETKAESFFKSHPLYKNYQDKSSQQQRVYMHAIDGHGLWDAQNPFYYHKIEESQQAMVVITRARIYFRKLASFWKYVPKVSKSMEGAPGLKYAKGIGELPLIQQATFSLWECQKDMMNYAYTMKKHQEVVKQTRRKKWYKEEMFIRFFPYRSEGNIKKLTL